MIILIHVLIALGSVGQTTLLLVSPSNRKLTVTYGLFLATVASGSYLLIVLPSHMIQTCIEGLLYMGFVVGAVVIAQKRLAKKTNN